MIQGGDWFSLNKLSLTRENDISPKKSTRSKFERHSFLHFWHGNLRRNTNRYTQEPKLTHS